jgi:hypothetical protein
VLIAGVLIAGVLIAGVLVAPEMALQVFQVAKKHGRLFTESTDDVGGRSPTVLHERFGSVTGVLCLGLGGAQ